MRKVTGYVSYDVTTNCPHCDKNLSLNQFPYPEKHTEMVDALGLAVFGTNSTPAKWHETNIQIECCGCKNTFVLEYIEH
jgi:hypothetical protein